MSAQAQWERFSALWTDKGRRFTYVGEDSLETRPRFLAADGVVLPEVAAEKAEQAVPANTAWAEAAVAEAPTVVVQKANDALPLQRPSGLWSRPEAVVVEKCLRHGDLATALLTLDKLSSEATRAVLLETGFVPGAAPSREAMLQGVEDALAQAAQEKRTGWELRAPRQEVRGLSAPSTTALGGKARMDEAGTAKAGPVQEAEARAPGEVVKAEGHVVAPPSAEFVEAVEAVKRVMAAPSVEVGVAGQGDLASRASLQFIGVQAIAGGISGFAIEGIAGKFKLPDSVDLGGLRAVYAASGAALAVREVRGAMATWAVGKSVGRVSDWVPEGASAVLRGPVTVEGAKSLRDMIAGEGVGQHGAAHGLRRAAEALNVQGVNLNARPAEQVAIDAGLKLVAKDTRRGEYVGPVVAQDHRVSVIKHAKDKAIVVSHAELPPGMDKPALGKSMQVKYRGDQLVMPDVSRAAGRGR